MFSVLGVGATAVLMPKWSTSRFWDVVVRNDITHISVMPFVIPTLMEADKPESHLRVGVFGLIMEALDQMCGIDVYAAYGMTETVIHATNGRPADRLPERSMGHITPGYEIAVVDKDTGHAVRARARPASSGCGERGASSCSSSTSTIPRRTRRRSRAAGSRPATWSCSARAATSSTGSATRTFSKSAGRTSRRARSRRSQSTVAGVGQVAVVGKHHDFLERGRRRLRDHGAAARPRPTSSQDQIIEACADAARRLQSAASRLRRRRVPARHPRQDPQEQAAGDGGRAAAGLMPAA